MNIKTSNIQFKFDGSQYWDMDFKCQFLSLNKKKKMVDNYRIVNPDKLFRILETKTSTITGKSTAKIVY